MGSRLIRAFCIALLMSVVCAANAWSQDLPDEAREAMEEGARHYENEEWADAAVSFRRAYAIAPYAIFMFNAARAAHQNGNRRQAYIYYQRSLDTSDEARKLPSELHSRASGIVAGLGADMVAMAVVQQLATPGAEENEGWSSIRWAGAATTVAGLGAMVAAQVMGAQASRGISELGSIRSFELYEASVARIERQQKVGRGLLYGGGGLVALGVGIALWDLLGEGDWKGPTLSVSPGQVQAIWEVRFD